MKTRLVMLAAALLVGVVFAQPTAAEDGWKMPNLNPFANKSAPPTGGGSGWKLPRLWPASTPASPFQPAGPSTLQKMKAGTRNAWNKTTDFLNPFDDAQDQPFPSVTGTNTAFGQSMQTSGKQQPKSSSFLPSWPWSSKDKEPETVNSFLAKPRPGF